MTFPPAGWAGPYNESGDAPTTLVPLPARDGHFAPTRTPCLGRATPPEGRGSFATLVLGEIPSRHEATLIGDDQQLCEPIDALLDEVMDTRTVPHDSLL